MKFNVVVLIKDDENPTGFIESNEELYVPDGTKWYKAEYNELLHSDEECTEGCSIYVSLVDSCSVGTAEIPEGADLFRLSPFGLDAVVLYNVVAASELDKNLITLEELEGNLKGRFMAVKRKDWIVTDRSSDECDRMTGAVYKVTGIHGGLPTMILCDSIEVTLNTNEIFYTDSHPVLSVDTHKGKSGTSIFMGSLTNSDDGYRSESTFVKDEDEAKEYYLQSKELAIKALSEDAEELSIDENLWFLK